MLCPNCGEKIDLKEIVENMIDYYENNQEYLDDVLYGEDKIGYVMDDGTCCINCMEIITVEITVAKEIDK